MTDVSTILGVGLLGFGTASAIYGSVLCYTTKVSTYAVFSDWLGGISTWKLGLDGIHIMGSIQFFLKNLIGVLAEVYRRLIKFGKWVMI